MDRRPPGIDPAQADEEPPAAAKPVTEAEWDRILPPIDESDPEWQAYERRMIREALDDPRPDLSAEEAFAEIDRFIADYKAKRGP